MFRTWRDDSPNPSHIVTGVLSYSELEQWLFDEEGIDLQYEAWCENHDPASDPYGDDYYSDGSGTVLYGAWKKVNGSYEPAKGEFSVISNGDLCTVQVVKSTWAIKCGYCSPCYPGQGDPSSNRHEVWAYCLPPDYMSDEWLKENGHRLWHKVWNWRKRGNVWRKWNEWKERESA